jgi:hypothetical protein
MVVRAKAGASRAEDDAPMIMLESDLSSPPCLLACELSLICFHHQHHHDVLLPRLDTAA